MQHTYQRPWVKIDEHVTEALSKIVGRSSDSFCAAYELIGPLCQAPTAPKSPAWVLSRPIFTPCSPPSTSLHLDVTRSCSRARRSLRIRCEPVLSRSRRLRRLTSPLQYAFASQAALHDYPSSSLLRVDPLAGEYTIRTEEILKIIEEEGESIAIICFGAVQYYSGEFFDMEAITKAGHAKVSRRGLGTSLSRS